MKQINHNPYDYIYVNHNPYDYIYDSNDIAKTDLKGDSIKKKLSYILLLTALPCAAIILKKLLKKGE